MDKYQIGRNAGILWRLLSDQRKWGYEELKEASGLFHYELCTAIGWLAREGKIEFEPGQPSSENNEDKYYLEFNVYI